MCATGQIATVLITAVTQKYIQMLALSLTRQMSCVLDWLSGLHW